MSRIYDDQPLENLPVNPTKWSGSFDVDCADKKSCRSNPGVMCEGKIVNQARISIINSNETAPQARYFILFVSIEQAHQRKYDDNGVEQKPNFNETTKVSTGYLNSSYDVKAKGNTDRLSTEQVVELISNSKISEMISAIIDKTSPKGDIAFLMKEVDRLKIKLGESSLVRITTSGGCPLIENLVVKDDLTSSKSNFAGDEKIGNDWLEKIVAAKAAQQAKEEPSEIADDEWDD